MSGVDSREEKRMLGQNFPVSEYYRSHIIDAHAISRAGGWWTAILLISDPQTGKPFIGLYKWQSDGEKWKTRNKFLIRKRADAKTLIDLLEKYSNKLKDSE